MARRRIIIDCDPGQDDAIALLMASAARTELEILGVCAVAGNAPLDWTERNARIVLELAGADVPVYPGCPRPLHYPLRTAAHVHGATGLDGYDAPAPGRPLQATHAVAFLIETLRAAAPASITVVLLGPMTNLAAALIQAPEIAAGIEEIVLMGGAMREGGNITPSAEFNVFVDPHAAEIVFRSGRPIAAFGLDVTHQVLCTPQVLARLAGLKTRLAEPVHGWLSFFNRFDSQKYASPGAPLHDPCTIAYLLAPELFQLKPCHLAVETGPGLARGHTAVDFWGVTGEPANCRWAHAVKADGFFDLLVSLLQRLE